ncbi:MAG: hypothetical protein ACM3U2_14375 [Deltaproteobacteria bacterium]
MANLNPGVPADAGVFALDLTPLLRRGPQHSHHAPYRRSSPNINEVERADRPLCFLAVTGHDDFTPSSFNSPNILVKSRWTTNFMLYPS